MKLMHLSDLHMGKRLGELSLLEDQEYILKQILAMAEKESPEITVIAGDLYDRQIPSTEAVTVLDVFLVALSRLCPQVFAISGNHDSPERIAFGSRLMDQSGVHFSRTFDGRLQKAVCVDAHGPVNIWMLPFIKTAHVRPFAEDLPEGDYTEAVRRVIDVSGVDSAERNILIAHQYVRGAQRSDSEERMIGGLEDVDSSVFEPFDYVALGHLHRTQRVGSDRIRYCGAPLKYSFAEAEDTKAILLVQIENKGDIQVKELPLHPLREMRVLKGSFDELMRAAEEEQGADREAYVRVELTDEHVIPDGVRQLRKYYPNILETVYPRVMVGTGENLIFDEDCPELTPQEYLQNFYRQMRGREMEHRQKAFAETLIRQIWEEEA